MKIETVLAILGFAMSLANFLTLVVKDATAKIVIPAVTSVSLILIFGLMLYQTHQHELQVASTSQSIIAELSEAEKEGKEAQPYDDLSRNIFQVDIALENDALARLDAARALGHKILRLRDDSGRQFEVWGFFVNTH